MQALDLLRQLINGSFLVGAVTFYPIDRFESQPLYCAQYLSDDLTYSHQTANIYGPWIALDISLYESGRIECGDKLLLWLEGQGTMQVVALDAGTFEGYWVQDWPTLPIIADLPEYYTSQSHRGLLIFPSE